MEEAGVFGGECPSCEGNVDYCGCTACERGACDHYGHCDNCGRGYFSQAEAEDGLCMSCQIQWMAKHQLPAPSTRSDVTLASGRVITHSLQPNGSQLAYMADGGTMSIAEWTEYCGNLPTDRRPLTAVMEAE